MVGDSLVSCVFLQWGNGLHKTVCPLGSRCSFEMLAELGERNQRLQDHLFPAKLGKQDEMPHLSHALL